MTKEDEIFTLYKKINEIEKKYSNMERLTERDACWLGEEFLVSAKEPDDETIDAVYEKLREYEDLEEQGLLLRLPCKVGDTVYVICECETIPPQLDGTLYGANGEPGTATGYYCPYEENCPHECFKSEDYFSCDYFKNKEAVFEDEVAAMWCDEFGVNIITSNCPVNSRLGEYVFLTKEEAEAALAKMEEGV